MTLLIVAVVAVLVISALCSLTEASLYAVRLSFVRRLAEAGSRRGRILSDFKSNMERPITAILVVNTAANTAGAAITGAQAEVVLGHQAVLWFSALFTLAVLVCSEIFPKILGVAFSHVVAPVVAVGLRGVTIVMSPLVWLVQLASRALLPSGHLAVAPEEEVSHLARMSAEEGSILPMEADLVQNVLKLDRITAGQIMTPRSVVNDFPGGMTLREVAEREKEWTHARLPLRSEDDPELWTGVVHRRDILVALAADEHDKKLEELSQPIHFVPHTARGHVLLRSFLAYRSHLFGVVDDRGSLVGVVTLEDVLESLLGQEIVDEFDVVVDMQKLARVRCREILEAGEPPAEGS